MNNVQDFIPSLEKMMQAGVHVGHNSSKWHPKMKDYIYSTKQNTHLLNLEITEQKLREALEYIYTSVAEGKKILFVSTKKQATATVKATAEHTEMPYMIRRWVGGVFTNYEVIQKRIKQIMTLEEKLLKGSLVSFTKKERKVFSDKIAKGNKLFQGLKEMNSKPVAIFVQDVARDELAIKEARSAGVKVIGLVDSNVNPELVDYPIPANDDSIAAIELIYGAVEKTILAAQGLKK
jgi:small subunit ribosomal protein S2